MMTDPDSTPNHSVTMHDYSRLEPLPHSALEPVPAQKEYYNPPAWAEQPVGGSRPYEPKQKILGLSVRAFWTIVVLLVVVLAAGIGGGVGGGLAARNSASASTPSQPPLSTGSQAADSQDTSPQSSSSSPSTTISTAPTSTTPTAAAGTSPAPTDEGCPNINGTAYTPIGPNGKALPLQSGGPAQQFLRLCSTNWPAGPAYGNPGVHDIMKMYLPSLEACITACAEYNVNLERNLGQGIGVVAGESGLCRAVSVVKAPGEYCYLKNNTGKVDTFGSPSTFSSAVLYMASSGADK